MGQAYELQNLKKVQNMPSYFHQLISSSTGFTSIVNMHHQRNNNNPNYMQRRFLLMFLFRKPHKSFDLFRLNAIFVRTDLNMFLCNKKNEEVDAS